MKRVKQGMRNLKCLFLLAVAVPCALCACQKKASMADSSPQLQLTVAPAADAYTIVRDSEIRKSFNSGVCFQGVKNVTICLDGEVLPLEDAIRQERVTPELIRYDCGTDVKNGFCVRQQTSYHGLNNETFHYPDYSLLLVDDLLEAPDGAQYPVTYLAVYNHLGETSIVADYMDPDTQQSATREDWGVTFSAEVSGDTIHLRCTQKANMEVGVLKILDCTVLDEDGQPIRLPSGSIQLDIGDGYELEPNATTEITISLDNALPEGSRCLSLGILDCFDSSELHPLIEKYHTYQVYQVSLK